MPFQIIYDITGLVTRQSVETPVGLDRVNLRYAEHLATRYPGKVLFVKQKGKHSTLIDTDDAIALINYLESRWSPDINSSRHNDSMSFRIEHSGILEPDFESFYALPFAERFKYLLNNDMRSELGPEFRWFDSIPYSIKVVYYLLGASSRRLGRFFVRVGRFIGVYSKIHNWKKASRAAFRERPPDIKLIDHLNLNIDREKKFYFINTSQYVGLSLNLLHEIKDSVRNIEFIFFIHDLLPIEYPEYFVTEFDNLVEARIKQILRLKPRIIANSEFTRQQVLDFAKAHKGLKPVSVDFAPIGAEKHFYSRTDLDRASNKEIYFVTICTIEPRKNHLLLLHIWRELHKFVSPVPHLYLVGKRGWENENTVDLLERSLTLQDTVHETANLLDEELVPLLANARALLFPSFCEGWGMPVVEALSLGTPVICSDIPALRESGQDIPDYIDPLDGNHWRRTIINYCDENSDLRNNQLDRIKNFKPPTWEDHFAKTLDRIITGS